MFFLFPDKVACLTTLGEIFLKEEQINKAEKIFENALEQAKKLCPGQPRIADILNGLGAALQRDGTLHESLRYLREAKEILVKNGEVGIHTSIVLNSIGTTYQRLDEYLLAFQSFKDSLDNLDMTMIRGEAYKVICKSMANTVKELSEVSMEKTRLSLIRELHKSVETGERRCMVFTKDTCPDDVGSFYQLSLFCKDCGKQDEVLKHLEKAREIAEEFDYKCGRMVLVLLLLSMTYGEMGSFDKSWSYYKEAKEMAKSLPPEDASILPGELGMIEWMKRVSVEKLQY